MFRYFGIFAHVGRSKIQQQSLADAKSVMLRDVDPESWTTIRAGATLAGVPLAQFVVEAAVGAARKKIAEKAAQR